MAEYNPSKIIKDGNTYNFRDTTKIPLAGTDALSGSIVPDTDNSVDLGSSSKNIKMIHTKGITINGTQFLPSDYATLSGLSTVATSGSYNDLSNKPTIPTVNNATLTIQRNGTTVDTFTANSSSNKTVNIQCVDLTNNQTVAGNKEFTGTTNIKSLTINGVACGDILTHNANEFANDTDVVHKSGNETIGGNKTFSNSPTVARQDVGTVGYNVKLGFKRGSEIATTNHSTFRVVDSDNEIISEICTENYADGKVAQILNVRNTNNESSQIQSSISHLLDKTGEQDWIVPSRDNKTYLGTSTNRWADVKTALINGKTPAYDSDVVHVKGSDDIIDSKTFISLYTQSSGPSLWMKNTSFTMGTAPTTNRYSGIWVQDSNGTDTAYIVHQANKNNSQNLKFSVSNTDGTTVYQNALTFQCRLDGTFNFYSDNPANLGTSTNKWAKVYSDDIVHTTSNETIDGVKTFTSNMVIQGSRKVTCNLDNSFIELDGGTTWGKGGSIVLSGQDRSSYTNSVLIVSKSDTNTDILQYQNGELKPLSNNTNNSSLGTSTNKWSKVYSDDVVHTTGDETIGGIKTFTDLQTISYGTKYKGNKDAYILPEFAAGYSGLSITTLSFSQTLKIGNFVLDNNNKPVLDTSKAYIQVATGENNNVNACLLEPRNSTSSSLGTSANKWKSFNGINPGALSLPSTYVNVDTTNWVLDGSQPNHFVPTSDGWFGIQCTDTVYDQTHYVFVGRTGGGSAYYQQNVISPVSALWDSKYHGCIFIPVIKNINYDIRCICSSITATFYPCQGNV